MTIDISQRLADLSVKTARELWKIAAGEPNVAGLVMPRYADHDSAGQDGELRLSEQEPRFAFARLAIDAGHLVSIETPTRVRHAFTAADGSSGRSAQHDLSIYREADRALLAHVEFKQGGLDTVEKDVEKLIASAHPSLFFHCYASKRASRIEFLVSGYADTVEQVLDRVSEQRRDEAIPIVLAFCSVFHRERVVLVRAASWSDLLAHLRAGIESAAWETFTP